MKGICHRNKEEKSVCKSFFYNIPKIIDKLPQFNKKGETNTHKKQQMEEGKFLMS